MWYLIPIGIIVYVINSIVINRRIKIKDSLKNFDYLEDIEREILWELFFDSQHKKKLNIYNTTTKNLKKNQYITELQIDEIAGMGIYKLNNKVVIFLKNKYIMKIKNDLKNISDTEKKVLNLFYEKSDKYIDSDMNNALSELEKKRIIIHEYNKYIKLYDIVVEENMNYFRPESFLSNSINLEDYTYPENSGSGARGNNTY